SERRFVRRRSLLKAAAGGSLMLLAPDAVAAPQMFLARDGEACAIDYAPLKPEQTVVVFADLQAGIIDRGVTNDLAHLRKAVLALAKRARLFDIRFAVPAAPVSNSPPQIPPEIAATLGSLPVYTRTTTDAFLHVDTRDAILAAGRSAILIAGVATEI